MNLQVEDEAEHDICCNDTLSLAASWRLWCSFCWRFILWAIFCMTVTLFLFDLPLTILSPQHIHTIAGMTLLIIVMFTLLGSFIPFRFAVKTVRVDALPSFWKQAIAAAAALLALAAVLIFCGEYLLIHVLPPVTTVRSHPDLQPAPIRIYHQNYPLPESDNQATVRTKRHGERCVYTVELYGSAVYLRLLTERNSIFRVVFLDQDGFIVYMEDLRTGAGAWMEVPENEVEHRRIVWQSGFRLNWSSYESISDCRLVPAGLLQTMTVNQNQAPAMLADFSQKDNMGMR